MSSKTIGMGIRLSPDEARQLDALARATGRSKGGVIRALVRLAQAHDVDTLTVIRNMRENKEAQPSV